MGTGPPVQDGAPRAPRGLRRTHWRSALIFIPAAGVLVFAAAVCGHAYGLPVFPWIVIVVGAAGVVAAVTWGRHGEDRPALWWWWNAAAAAGAGWLVYARLASARSPVTWLTGVAVLAALTVSRPLARSHAARREKMVRSWQERRERSRVENLWPRVLAAAGIHGVTAEPGSYERTASGYALCLRLPAGGKVTRDTLAAATGRLEVAARLRKGAIRFEDPRDSAARVWLSVWR
jgi:hypothetical protein